MKPSILDLLLGSLHTERVAAQLTEDEADMLVRAVDRVESLSPLLVTLLAGRFPAWPWRHERLGAYFVGVAPNEARVSALKHPAMAVSAGHAVLLPVEVIRVEVAKDPELLAALPDGVMVEALDETLVAQLMESAPRTLIRRAGMYLTHQLVVRTALCAMSEAEKLANATMAADWTMKLDLRCSPGNATYAQAVTDRNVQVVGVAVPCTLVTGQVTSYLQINARRHSLGLVHHWTRHEGTWRWKFANPPEARAGDQIVLQMEHGRETTQGESTGTLYLAAVDCVG